MQNASALDGSTRTATSQGLTLVGVSGGVDSSVAAWLLAERGERVAGMFMKNWEEDDRLGPCRAEQDRVDAVAVCARLNIPFYSRNFAGQYWDGVFTHFLAEYRAGRTPNPDVLCNREIKFKTFLEQARELGAERIATGHYARIDCRDGVYRLLRGHDGNKDQSYFLYTLGQAQLAVTRFPIGELPKTDVRRLARAAGFAVHDKKDSTGICFIGERDFREFLGRYLPAQPGRIQTPRHRDLGEHQGLMYYTLGQRQGLGIGGRTLSSGAPWYVIGKDLGQNILYVEQGQDSGWLLSRRLEADDLSWTSGAAPAEEFACTAKTRYRQPDQACRVRITGSGCDVLFEQPQRAVTPGQSVVFYRDQECLGGGVINRTDAPFGGLGAVAGIKYPEPAHA